MKDQFHERQSPEGSSIGHQGADVVADELRAARKLIERPGDWGKGTPINRPGTRCASEAIQQTRGDIAAMFMAFSKAANIPQTSCIPEWNDAPERTHAEVLAAFDRAIEATTTNPS